MEHTWKGNIFIGEWIWTKIGPLNEYFHLLIFYKAQTYMQSNKIHKYAKTLNTLVLSLACSVAGKRQWAEQSCFYSLSWEVCQYWWDRVISVPNNWSNVEFLDFFLCLVPLFYWYADNAAAVRLVYGKVTQGRSSTGVHTGVLDMWSQKVRGSAAGAEPVWSPAQCRCFVGVLCEARKWGGSNVFWRRG